MYKSAQLARKTFHLTYKISSSSLRPSQRLLFSTTSYRNQPLDLKELWGLSKMSVPNKEIPKHEMAYFKALASSKRDFGDFRRVLFTGLYSQLVVMEVPVGGEIGDEVHTVDQVLIFTSGNGLATVAGKDQAVGPGDVVIVPAGTQHQFVTKGDAPLELITIYSPAEHLPTTVHKTKEEGDKEEDEGIDEAPEWAGKSKKENEAAGLVKESGKYE